MNHSYPEYYSRADSLSGWLTVILGAGALILGAFLVLALLCIAQGLRHRQDRPSRRAWRDK